LVINLVITVVLRRALFFSRVCVMSSDTETTPAELTGKEGHHTITAEESSYMVKLFAAQFMSTGIGIMLAGLFYMWWLNGFGNLPSLNSNWYSIVGDFAVSANCLF
jgi:hypothetical protein